MESYEVEIDEYGWDDDTPVTGGTCEKVSDVTDIEECSLTPGDPSPIGRCPETGELVYLDRPIDRMREHAEKLFSIIKAVRPELVAAKMHLTVQALDALVAEIEA